MEYDSAIKRNAFESVLMRWRNIIQSEMSQKEKDNNIYLLTGEGNGNPLQYRCLENLMGRGAWEAAVHGVAKSWTRLSDFTFTLHFYALEKEMATHSSVLAWRLQRRRSLVGCRLWGCTESDTTEAT